MTTSLSDWSSDYLKRLQKAYGLGAQPVGTSSPVDLSSALSGYRRQDFTSAIQDAIPQAAPSPGLGSRIMDVLMRPAYGAGNYLSYLSDRVNNREPVAENAGAAVWSGLSGKSKVTGMDLAAKELENSSAPAWLKTGAILTAGLASDPLTYVGLGSARTALGGAVRAKTGATSIADDAAKVSAARNARGHELIAESKNLERNQPAVRLAEDVTHPNKNNSAIDSILKSRQDAKPFDEPSRFGTSSAERGFSTKPEGAVGVDAPNGLIKSILSAPRQLESGVSFKAGSSGVEPVGKLRQAAKLDPDHFIAQTRVDALNKALTDAETLRYGSRPQIDNVYDSPLNLVEGRRSAAANKEWVAANRNRLAQEDIEYIQGARTAKTTQSRINEVRNRGEGVGSASRAVPGPVPLTRDPATGLVRTVESSPETIGTLDNFVSLVREGRVTEESVDNVMRAVGATTPAEISVKAGEAIKAWGAVEGKRVAELNKATAKVSKATDDAQSIIARERVVQRSDEIVPIAEPLVTPTVSAERLEELHKLGVIDKNAVAIGVKTPRDVKTQAGELSNVTRLVDSQIRKELGQKRYDALMRTDNGVDLRNLKLGKALPLLKDIKAVKESKGFYGSIRSSPNSPTAWDLDFSDIFEIMPKVAADYHFNPLKKQKAYQTQIAAAVAKSMDLSLSTIPSVTKTEQIVEAARVAVSGATKNKTSQGTLEAIAYEAQRATPKLLDRAAENLARRSTKDAADISAISDFAVEAVTKAVNSPASSVGQAIKELANIPTTVANRAKYLGASKAAESLAAVRTTEQIAKITEPLTVDAARVAVRVANDAEHGVPRTKTMERIQNLGTRGADDAEDMLASGVERVTDLDIKAATRIQGRQRMFLGFGRAVLGVNTRELRETYRRGYSVAMKEAENFRVALNGIARKHSSDDMKAVSSALKSGQVLDSPAYTETVKLWNLVFDTSPETAKLGMSGVFFRNGVPTEVTNSAMKRFGIKGQFNPDAMVINGERVSELELAVGQLKDVGKGLKGSAKVEHTAELKRLSVELKEAKTGRKVNTEELSQQWRTWDSDMEEPLDFMQRIFSAVQHTSALHGVGGEFTDLFGILKLPKGANPAEWTKIKGVNSRLMPFIDANRLYPIEAAEKLQDLEKMLSQATSFRGEKGILPSFVNKVLDPAMSIFKPVVTIFRPGHHVRNLMGDVSSGLLDGVKNPKYYGIAAQMLKAGGKYRGDPDAFIAGLKGLSLDPNAAVVLRTAPIGGKTFDFSADSLYRLADKNGLFPEYRVGQDLIGDINAASKSKTEKLREALVENRYGHAAGRLSEFTSHGTRAAHFAALMARPKFVGKFKTVEQAAAAAAARVRRFHPDVTGLTPFEQKYMRRIIPFYSWTRQAIPILFETMLTNPGRVTQIPKAMYSLALANGVNPDSFSDPFPPDQLFPSFVRDGLLGPVTQGGHLINFGSVAEGVLGGGGQGLLNGNLLRNVAGQASPFIKAPIELATQTSLGTGAHISDMSEYTDSQIPFVNHASTLSGYSVTGSIGNAFNGEGLDPQRSMEKGEKDFILNQSTMNFLLGLGIQDTQKPSYQKIAARETAKEQMAELPPWLNPKPKKKRGY